MYNMSSDVQLRVVEVQNGGWDRRVRVFRAGDEVDTYAVTTERYVVLVDTMATPEFALDVANAMRSELSQRQLLVVNTHADYDHCWGNSVFTSPGGSYPAPILAHERARDRLSRPETLQFLEERKRQEPRFANVKIVEPTITFTSRVSIRGGDLTLRLIPTPGHTEDHVSVWIPEIRLLLAGDAAEHPFPYVTRAEALPILRKSLHRMIDLNPAMALPSHGGTHDSGLLSRNLRYLDDVERHVREAITRDGVPKDWYEREDLPGIVGLPFDHALLDIDVSSSGIPAFYRSVHLYAVRGTVANLLASEGDRRAYRVYRDAMPKEGA
jgi:glyoxylase-like metal-dependent hydrolase (beta-lactamase superfamily II)